MMRAGPERGQDCLAGTDRGRSGPLCSRSQVHGPVEGASRPLREQTAPRRRASKTAWGICPMAGSGAPPRLVFESCLPLQLLLSLSASRLAQRPSRAPPAALSPALALQGTASPLPEVTVPAHTDWLVLLVPLALSGAGHASPEEPARPEERDQDVAGTEVLASSKADEATNEQVPAPGADDYVQGWVRQWAEELLLLARQDPEAYLEELQLAWSETPDTERPVAIGAGPTLPVIVFEQLLAEALPEAGAVALVAAGRVATGRVATDRVAGEKLPDPAAAGSGPDQPIELTPEEWQLLEGIEDPAELLATLVELHGEHAPGAALHALLAADVPLRGAELTADYLEQRAALLLATLAPFTLAPHALSPGTTRSALLYARLQQLPGMPGIGAEDHGGQSMRVLGRRIRALQSAGLGSEALGLLEAGALPEQHQAALLALVGVTSARLMAAERTGQHPFYRAELVEVEALFMGDSFGDGSDRSWALWHPFVEDGSERISLGDMVTVRGAAPSTCRVLGGEAVAEGRDIWWTRPVDYELVWTDGCSGGLHARSIWAPVAPEGFTAVGFVAGGPAEEKPLPDRIACLRDDLALLTRTDGMSAGLQFVGSDEGSQSPLDVTLYRRRFAGIELLHARPGAHQENRRTYTLSLEVPVAWGRPDFGRGIVWGSEEQRSHQRGGRRQQAGLDPSPVLTHSILREPEHRPIAYITSTGGIIAPAPEGPAEHVLLGQVQVSFTGRFQRILHLDHLGGQTYGVTGDGLALTLDGVLWGRVESLAAEEETGAESPFTHELRETVLLRGSYAAVGLEEGGVLIALDGAGTPATIGHLVPTRLGHLAQRVVRDDGGPDSLIDSAGGVWTRDTTGEWTPDGRLRCLTGASHLASASQQAGGSRQGSETPAPKITHEVVLGDRDGRFFTTTGGEVVEPAGVGAYRPVGRISEYGGPRRDPWRRVITTTDGLRWLMDVEGELWPTGTAIDGTTHDGSRKLGLVGPVGALEGVKILGNPLEAGTREAAASPSFERRLILAASPGRSYLVTATSEVLEVGDDGGSIPYGRLRPIEHESFVEELLGVDGARSWLDRSGGLWVNEDGSWLQAGKIEELRVPEQPATVRTLVLADAAPGHYSIDTENRVIHVDHDGRRRVVGRVTPIHHKSFVEEMLSKDGERAWIDRGGLIWVHDGEGWQEAGRVLQDSRGAERAPSSSRPGSAKLPLQRPLRGDAERRG